MRWAKNGPLQIREKPQRPHLSYCVEHFQCFIPSTREPLPCSLSRPRPLGWDEVGQLIGLLGGADDTKLVQGAVRGEQLSYSRFFQRSRAQRLLVR